MPRHDRHLNSVPDIPLRVVLYVRVSALMGRGGSDFHSPEIQVDFIRRKTTPLGYVEVDVVDDIDETGRTFARKGIDKIKRMAENGQMDALAVLDVSRLGRNVLESLKFLSWLADRGVTIISAVEHVDTSTPSGRLMLNNMLSIAQYRGEEIGAGWARLIDKRANAGFHHGPAPLGYTYVDKQLQPHPVFGPALAECYRMYHDGATMLAVCVYLASLRRRQMDTSNMRRMLRSPVYAGFIIHNKETLPGNHTPLVSFEVWQQVQDRLTAESFTPPRALGPTWFGVGFTYCPDGHRIHKTTFKERGGIVSRLVCGSGKGRLTGGCDGIGRPLLHLVENEVLRQVREYIKLLRTDVVAHATRQARVASARADRDTLGQELAKTRRAMGKLTANWALNDTPETAYRAAMTELKQAEAALASELANSRMMADLPTPQEAANAAEAMLRLWPDMQPHHKVRALRDVVDRVVIRKAEHWRESPARCTEVFFL